MKLGTCEAKYIKLASLISPQCFPQLFLLPMHAILFLYGFGNKAGQKLCEGAYVFINVSSLQGLLICHALFGRDDSP